MVPGKSNMLNKLRRLITLLLFSVFPISGCTYYSGNEDEMLKVKGPKKVFLNSVGVELLLIPAGEFLMGNDESLDKLSAEFKSSSAFSKNAEPQHHVEITKPFYLAKHEVTVGQFKKFVVETKYQTEAEKEYGGWGYLKNRGLDERPEYNWKNPGWDQTDSHPVGNVTWNDALSYCHWLSKKESKEYRLPTEAEWEYACRAGTQTRYSNGNDPEGLAVIGNVFDGTATEISRGGKKVAITAKDGYVFTAPVGKFHPNTFGLHDMHGNVWEWCADWYEIKQNFYETSPVEDPAGLSAPPIGSPKRMYKVIRGGSWNTSASDCRSATRECAAMGGPMSRNCELGFRIALSIEPTSTKKNPSP